MTKKKEENVENNIVNEYEIQLGPVDHLGHKWAENLIKYTKLGAEVKKGSLIKATFPHHVWLTISTSEVLKNEPGVQVFRINETFTKEQLELMDWETFRESVAQKRIRGRKRDDMMRAYLKATGQDPDAISKNKLVPKGGFVEEEGPEKTEETSKQAQEELQNALQELVEVVEKESENKVEETSEEKEE